MKWFVKLFSAFFTGFWLFMAGMAIMGYITPWIAACACLLAAFYNLEDVLN